MWTFCAAYMSGLLKHLVMNLISMSMCLSGQENDPSVLCWRFLPPRLAGGISEPSKYSILYKAELVLKIMLPLLGRFGGKNDR